MELDLEEILQLEPAEKLTYEREQNLYSIIKTIEYLEWAYMSGKVKGKEYDKEFCALYHHYSIIRESMDGFKGLDPFMKKYQLEHCDSAKKVIQQGKSNYKGEETESGLAARVMDITSKMINAIDLLQLEDYYDVH